MRSPRRTGPCALATASSGSDAVCAKWPAKRAGSTHSSHGVFHWFIVEALLVEDRVGIVGLEHGALYERPEGVDGPQHAVMGS